MENLHENRLKFTGNHGFISSGNILQGSDLFRLSLLDTGTITNITHEQIPYLPFVYTIPV